MQFVTMKPRPDLRGMEKYITDYINEIFSYNHSHEFSCDIQLNRSEIEVECSLTIVDQCLPARTKSLKISLCEEFNFSDNYTEAKISEEMKKICDEVIMQLIRDAFFECYRYIYEKEGK